MYDIKLKYRGKAYWNVRLSGEADLKVKGIILFRNAREKFFLCLEHQSTTIW